MSKNTNAAAPWVTNDIKQERLTPMTFLPLLSHLGPWSVVDSEVGLNVEAVERLSNSGVAQRSRPPGWIFWQDLCGRCVCSVAQRIFPTKGSHPHLLHWQADSLSTVPPGQLLPTDPQYQNVICCCEIFNTGTLASVQVSDTPWPLRKLGERENQEMGESLPLAPPTYLDWILWNHHLWWLQNENSVRPPELTPSLSRKCSSKIKIKIFQIREKKRSAIPQDALFPGELSGCYRVSRAVYAP